MDLAALNQQVNDALNRWLEALVSYFDGLSQMEWYGWALFVFGLVLFVVGLFLL